MCYFFHRDTVWPAWLSHSEALLHLVLNVQRPSQGKYAAPPASPNTAAANPAGCTTLGLQPPVSEGSEHRDLSRGFYHSVNQAMPV